MSCHLFCATLLPPAPDAGATVEVSAGWDRPLQQFYARVLREEGTGSSQEQVLFDALGEPAGGYASAEEVAQALGRAGVALPAGLLATLRADGASNAGRRVVRWTEAGPDLLAT